jgi:hypothetical protein
MFFFIIIIFISNLKIWMNLRILIILLNLSGLKFL